MSKEAIILASVWLLTIILLIIYVPKEKIRHANIIFLFKQSITWLFGLTVVEFKLIQYPYRIFEHAHNTSFSFEFFIFPGICVLFNLYYPVKKNKLKKLIHYINYCTLITIIEIILERYTDLINYINWSWFWTWITLLVTFYASRKYYLWFFKHKISQNQD